jgi:ribosomal protein S18 acetylase RimI-like enzyme
VIGIEEIPRKDIDTFWVLHWEYLNRDIFDDTFSEEDRAYFKSDAYRKSIERFLEREPDRVHMVYFTEGEQRVGCAQYIIYMSEDYKCLILDFWVFPEHRGNGMGHRCFEALTAYTNEDSATYYSINCSDERAKKFWRSLGFVDDGVDEYGEPLMKKVGS